MNNVGLITCVKLPDPDHDEALLLSALKDCGLDAKLVAWDDPKADPGAFDLCVLRSCWNYYEDPERFLAWIDDAAARTKLLNPVSIVRWNVHKRYLKEMEEAGVPTIPTAWFDRGGAGDLRATLQEREWDDVVVKPAVSAGSYRTKRFRRSDAEAGQAFLDDLLHDHDVMVQRYMQTVESDGERAVVWIDGEFTHAVCKRPRFSGNEESITLAPPLSEEDEAFVHKALSCVSADLLYGRVDVVNDDNGNMIVSELELLEPSLFLREKPSALERFVKAIARRCETK